MDYLQIKQLLNKLKETYEQIGIDVNFDLEPPANETEVLALEKQVKMRLPAEIRNFFLKFSKNCEFNAFLPDDLKLPKELCGIFSACFIISLDEVKRAEESRESWQRECFSNEADEYDRVWHHKLGIMTVGNGDVIALDIALDKDNPPVVYLSHDDGEGHGYILGKTFNQYLENLLLVGGCGNEDWQMLPFCPNKESGIDPECQNAKMYREIIKLGE